MIELINFNIYLTQNKQMSQTNSCKTATNSHSELLVYKISETNNYSTGDPRVTFTYG